MRWFGVLLTAVVALAGCNAHKEAPVLLPLSEAAPSVSPLEQLAPAEPAATELARQSAPESQPAPAQLTLPASAPTPVAQPAGVWVLQAGPGVVRVADLIRLSHGKLTQAAKLPADDAFAREAQIILRDTLWLLLGEVLAEPEADKRLPEEAKKQIDKEVDEVLRELVSAAGGSRSAADAKLRLEGTSLEQALADHRRSLTVSTYVRAKLNPDIVISRRQLWEYYQAHQAQFSKPRKVQMQIIAMPFRAYLPGTAGVPSETELKLAQAAAREAIESAKTALAGGEDFGEVAKRFSKDAKAGAGGLWPMMEPGSFRETKVEQAAFALESGGISGVIEGAEAYYIVKAAKVEPASAISFEAAQPQIETAIRREQHQRLSEEYYSRLMIDANLADPGPFLKSALDEARRQFRGK